MFSKTLVIICTFNEKKNISKVIKDVHKNFKNILVIDNNSEDQTLSKVRNFSVKFTNHIYNLGKSNSMKTGFDYAVIRKFEYLAFIDGDGQHLGKDLKKLCEKIYESNSDIVIGYRKNIQYLNFQKMIGTKILEKLFYLLYRKKILDIQSGMRVLKTKIKKKVDWESTGIIHYFADAEITCNAVKNRCIINQMPISTISSEKYKGMNLIQGLLLMFMLFIWKFYK